MTRKLKTLGLTLVAAFALSAVAASAASAETAVVVGGPSVLGHDNPEGVTELTGALGVGCDSATYPGSAEESTITLGLEFAECATAEGAPFTITDNGCQYQLTLGTLETHTADATAALVCPKGELVDIMIFEDEAHEVEVCAIEIVQQGGLTGLHVSDETNGHLRITGTVGGIENYLDGGCVENQTTPVPDAELHVDITLTPGEKKGELGLA